MSTCVLLACSLLAFVGPDWHTVQEEGQFVVQMPGMPTREVKELESPDGKIVATRYRLYTEDKRGFNVQAIEWIELTEDISTEQAKAIIDKVASNQKGKVVENKEVKIGDSVGRDLLAVMPDGVKLRQRVWIAGKTQYVLMTAGNVSAEDANRFLASFKIAARK
jgi:hypothetical protein